MDPSNLRSQSSSYVRLFHSQQGSVFHENFPYESFHSSVNFGESQTFPAFSSQQSQDAPVETPVKTPAARVDAIVANEQRSGAFWKRVAAYYASSPHGREDGVREHGCCKKRWHRINEDVNKFCATYSAAERQMRSVETDTDVLKKAHDSFFSDQEHKFTLEHAWCVLRYEQKWLSLTTPTAGGVSKRKNVEINSQTSTNEGFVDVESRPEGVKAAKAKRNTGKGKSVAEIATVWEMKKDDLVRKERLSRLAILDTLLGKTQPFSEAEEVVKNKLIAELF
ncbi:PREDICTED: glutathione S-transferase T3-like [Brassica oleracea var. oleracea]|uniref:No apical meristem-associated C-terminal domain-containing protein n=1 Tax=Brassica oleracea var. oleracea TaxID=109376 RepID=A0A0D3BLV8_BRAOL|nr:PREDICTED: glutathione S-transferase T3-like [Brassica oleracea var. oleracea]